MTVIRNPIAACAISILLIGAAIGEQYDYPGAYAMRFDGLIEGEIEILSYSWSETRPGAHDQPKADPGSIRITAPGGKHSEMFAKWNREQTRLPAVQLVSDNPQDAYYKITFSDVLVSSYQSSGSAGGDAIPTDQISLNFSKIEYEYKPQKERK